MKDYPSEGRLMEAKEKAKSVSYKKELGLETFIFPVIFVGIFVCDSDGLGQCDQHHDEYSLSAAH